MELSFFSKDDPGRGIGAGLSSIDSGLRLRYEITRKFAPYVGVTYQRSFGGTARAEREVGVPVNDTRFVFGLRTWF